MSHPINTIWDENLAELTAEREAQEREQEKRDAFDILFNADLRNALKSDRTKIFETPIDEINRQSFLLGVQDVFDYTKNCERLGILIF